MPDTVRPRPNPRRATWAGTECLPCDQWGTVFCDECDGYGMVGFNPYKTANVAEMQKLLMNPPKLVRDRTCPRCTGVGWVIHQPCRGTGVRPL